MFMSISLIFPPFTISSFHMSSHGSTPPTCECTPILTMEYIFNITVYELFLTYCEHQGMSPDDHCLCHQACCTVRHAAMDLLAKPSLLGLFQRAKSMMEDPTLLTHLQGILSNGETQGRKLSWGEELLGSSLAVLVKVCIHERYSFLGTCWLMFQVPVQELLVKEPSQKWSHEDKVVEGREGSSHVFKQKREMIHRK